MKQIFLTLSATLMLTGCNGLFNGKADTAASDSDSIVSAADSLSAEGFEEGEADGTEAQGLSIYDQQDFDDLSALPSSAEETDRMFNHVLYVNVEQAPSEDDPVGLYTVWVVDERWDQLRRVLTTNPTAAPAWDQMQGKNANGVEVPIHLVAVASSAQYASSDYRKIVVEGCPAPGDVSKVIVEGCPDGRNTWTYIIDLVDRTAIQLPSTEGVQEIDMDKGEIIAASYGYYPAPDYGRYTVNKAYSLEGKFLRQVGEPQPE